MGTVNTFISKLFGTKQSPAWADTQPLKTVARNSSGVVVGARDGEPLIDATMSPVAVLGPCQSGKGTSIVVPSLLTWRESIIVTDVHNELHGITAHWRREEALNEVRRLDFCDPSSPDTYNFLDAIPRGAPGELADIQALSVALLDDSQPCLVDGQGDRNNWRRHAQSLLTLFIIARRRSLVASLHDVQRAVIDNAAFGAIVASSRDLIPSTDLGHVAKAAATAYLELDDETRAGVREMVANSLSIFASPDVARNTMRSSFDLAELRDGKAAMTLYFTITPHRLSQIQPLIRAFFTQVVRHGISERPQGSAHRLLLILDEFPALGRLSFLENSLVSLSDHGIKLLLTIPSLSRLNRVYGEKNSLWAQCVVRTVLPVNEFATAAAVAADIDASVAQTDQPITADELMRLGKREAIILGVAAKPIRAATLPYYEDAGFSACVATGNADPLMSGTKGA